MLQNDEGPLNGKFTLSNSITKRIRSAISALDACSIRN